MFDIMFLNHFSRAIFEGKYIQVVAELTKQFGLGTTLDVVGVGG